MPWKNGVAEIEVAGVELHLEVRVVLHRRREVGHHVEAAADQAVDRAGRGAPCSSVLRRRRTGWNARPSPNLSSLRDVVVERAHVRRADGRRERVVVRLLLERVHRRAREARVEAAGRRLRAVLERLLELAAGDAQVRLADVVDREARVLVELRGDVRRDRPPGSAAPCWSASAYSVIAKCSTSATSAFRSAGTSAPSLWWYQAVAA